MIKLKQLLLDDNHAKSPYSMNDVDGHPLMPKKTYKILDHGLVGELVQKYPDAYMAKFHIKSIYDPHLATKNSITPKFVGKHMDIVCQGNFKHLP